jgi:hypothetical protein
MGRKISYNEQLDGIALFTVNTNIHQKLGNIKKMGNKKRETNTKYITL